MYIDFTSPWCEYPANSWQYFNITPQDCRRRKGPRSWAELDILLPEVKEAFPFCRFNVHLHVPNFFYLYDLFSAVSYTRYASKTAVPFTIFFAQMKKWRSLSGSVIRKTLRPPPTFKKFLPCGGIENTVTTKPGNFTPTLTYRSRTRPAYIAESLTNRGSLSASNRLPPSTASYNASISVFIPFPVGGHLEAHKVVHRCLKT